MASLYRLRVHRRFIAVTLFVCLPLLLLGFGTATEFNVSIHSFEARRQHLAVLWSFVGGMVILALSARFALRVFSPASRGTAEDIIECSPVEADLRLLSTVVAESISSIIITDAGENVVYVNRAFERLSGYSLSELRGRHPGDILQGPQTSAETRQCIRKAMEARQPISVEILNYAKSGEPYWIEMHITPVYQHDGIVTHFVAIENDVTRRKQAEQQLEDTNSQFELQILRVHEQATELEAANQRLTALATTDGLTGLKNHRAFQEILAAEWGRTMRSDSPLSIVLLDVDHFKSYNDAFGHPEGDQVLKTVASVMRDVARQKDTLCRYGGEEFVIVLPDTDEVGAVHAAERYQAALEAFPWALRPITASFGVASLQAEAERGKTNPHGIGSAQALIAAADKALYASKKGGRNRVIHAAQLGSMDDTDELTGNAGLPYTNIMNEVLQLQTETLASASEQIRVSLAKVYDATILSWSCLLDMRDRETEGHSRRVADLMVEVARSIGMNEEEVLYARWGALLHDVGKMGIPDAILHKPAPLTDEERELMKQHTEIAFKMLSPIVFLRPALDIPYYHHEWWDGNGYPRSLQGNEIPLTARLFAVIDVYDSLTNDRPYREAWPEWKAVQHIRSLSGSHFDPRAVKVFLAALTRRQTEQHGQQDRLAA